MTIEQLKEIWCDEANDRTCLDWFEDLPKEQKKASRRDLHAFMILDGLLPGGFKMVAGAEHDQIWLEPSPEELLAAGITEEQIRHLCACGIHYDEDTESLFMFV